jgi:hypothetical protein
MLGCLLTYVAAGTWLVQEATWPERLPRQMTVGCVGYKPEVKQLGIFLDFIC